MRHLVSICALVGSILVGYEPSGTSGFTEQRARTAGVHQGNVKAETPDIEQLRLLLEKEALRLKTPETLKFNSKEWVKGKEFYFTAAVSDTNLVKTPYADGLVMVPSSATDSALAAWSEENPRTLFVKHDPYLVAEQTATMLYDQMREPLLNAKPQAKSLEFVTISNFPNPFNPSTTISYALPMECDVRMSVTNLLGQTLQAKEIQHEKQGQHQKTFIFDESTPSGVYFFRLEAESATKRLQGTQRVIYQK